VAPATVGGETEGEERGRMGRRNQCSRRPLGNKRP